MANSMNTLETIAVSVTVLKMNTWRRSKMTKKDNDPFGFNKAINWDKLEDPKVLKELEKLFDEEEKKEDE